MVHSDRGVGSVHAFNPALEGADGVSLELTLA
ncbi:hypothetical protein AXFE_04230 [Acidithrix ferrooxidans]|uniref:Uncharacterized protein n=1 Tax=Acidithrix ferrooxidans TaxID=1280514 RepID=A0A0D8HNI3_9ACTN|nr:hypothetical protein AXFE_04230 [Acidithrix ferrooxidans]